MQNTYHAIFDFPECSIFIPPPPEKPLNKRALCLRILADLGGISSITEIHRAAQRINRPLSRQYISRIIQQHSQITPLGGGYYAFTELDILPVHQWLHHWLSMEGTQSAQSCVEAISTHYPKGDPKTISRWLQRGVSNITKGWFGYSAKGKNILFTVPP